MNKLYWLQSRTYRNACDLRKQVIKYLNHQRDLLKPASIQAIQEGVQVMEEVLKRPPENEVLQPACSALEKVANEHLLAYRNPGARENVEVILIAVVVALGIRTFFLQPFKIPTGSMQPTLFGITHTDLRQDPEAVIPGFFGQWFQSWFLGTSYYHLQAESGGRIQKIEPRKRILPFVYRQRIQIGNTWQTIWFPPEDLMVRAGLRHPQYEQYVDHEFQPGEDVIKLKMISGDHLFVDRMTYNFRQPHRGEIIVFKTAGIPQLEQDLFYIKRLVALGGETVSIGDDHHLVIDGNRLDAAIPRFEMVYSFPKEYDPERHQYFGHANGRVAREYKGGFMSISPKFPDQDSSFQVRPDHLLVMGDNTLNSWDSRGWGDFSRTNVIGKSAFVYWPISPRFGWSHR